MSHFFNNNHRCILIQHLVDGHHAAHFHQYFNDIGRLHRHFLSQGTHGNCFRHHNFTYNGFRRCRKTMDILIIYMCWFAMLVSTCTPALASGKIATGFNTAFFGIFIFPNNLLFGLFLFLLCFFFRLHYRFMQCPISRVGMQLSFNFLFSLRFPDNRRLHIMF